jgi:hypothetical protein
MNKATQAPANASAGDMFRIKLVGDDWASSGKFGSAVTAGNRYFGTLTDYEGRNEFQLTDFPDADGKPIFAFLPDGQDDTFLCEIIEQVSKSASISRVSSDPVNSPEHDKSGGLEVIDVIEAFGIDRKSGHLQNVIKYGLRAGEKGELQEDVDKLVWYALRLQARVRANGGAW